MKTIDNYIIEKLKIGKTTKQQYTCQPKDRDELRKILEEQLAKDKNADLNDIDVSQIRDFGAKRNMGLFEGLDPHNIKIDKWNMSNAIDMNCMFYECINFDCYLGDWDVSNAKTMMGLFYKCEKFEGNGLENWNVSSDTVLYSMFMDCSSLKNRPDWYTIKHC